MPDIGFLDNDLGDARMVDKKGPEEGLKRGEKKVIAINGDASYMPF